LGKVVDINYKHKQQVGKIEAKQFGMSKTVKTEIPGKEKR